MPFYFTPVLLIVWWLSWSLFSPTTWYDFITMYFRAKCVLFNVASKSSPNVRDTDFSYVFLRTFGSDFINCVPIQLCNSVCIDGCTIAVGSYACTRVSVTCHVIRTTVPRGKMFRKELQRCFGGRFSISVEIIDSNSAILEVDFWRKTIVQQRKPHHLSVCRKKHNNWNQ